MIKLKIEANCNGAVMGVPEGIVYIGGLTSDGVLVAC